MVIFLGFFGWEVSLDVNKDISNILDQFMFKRLIRMGVVGKFGEVRIVKDNSQSSV